jgi:hypothetical protein
MDDTVRAENIVAPAVDPIRRIAGRPNRYVSVTGLAAMEFGLFTVGGEDVSDLAGEVIDVEKQRSAGRFNPDANDIYRYAGDGFTLLTYESWDAVRTNSMLMVAMLFEQADGETARVAVMAGGGGEGIRKKDYTPESLLASELLGTEAGAEAVAFERAVDDVERACDSLGLNVETDN